MTEYGYDIGNAKVYTDEELTLEFDASHLTREDWERILGGIPIVRCKDCKYYTYYHECTCDHWDTDPGCEYPSVNESDYCSYGERRTDEAN